MIWLGGQGRNPLVVQHIPIQCRRDRRRSYRSAREVSALTETSPRLANS
jgi:hypothetical protein